MKCQSCHQPVHQCPTCGAREQPVGKWVYVVTPPRKTPEEEAAEWRALGRTVAVGAALGAVLLALNLPGGWSPWIYLWIIPVVFAWNVPWTREAQLHFWSEARALFTREGWRTPPQDTTKETR